MHGNRTLMVTVDLDKSYQPLPLSTVYHKLIPVETSPYTLFQTIIGNGYPVSLLKFSQNATTTLSSGSLYLIR
jgi:E3 ubiquitin-protein ligase MUL1